MRKDILTAVALLPLLVSLSQAEQNWTMESSQPFVMSSEDSGTTSYLGVDIADISTDRLGALKLKEEKGVEVTMVDQDAPAGKAGIKEHDVILTMNNAPVESKSQLQRMIHETPAGRVVTLGLSRDGQPVTIKVQLADRSKEFVHVGKGKDSNFHFEMPPMPNLPDFDVPAIDVVMAHSSVRSGVMVENLTPQLGEFFGAKNGSGVLVRSVEKGSRGDKAGLRAGDVIVRVGEQFVHDTSDFTQALRSRSSGSVNVEVIRDKKTQTLTLSLPMHKESGVVIEESFDAPRLDAETQTELSQVQDEVARLRPQLELAMEQSRKVSEEMRKAACEQQKEMTEQQKQIKEQARKLRQQFDMQLREQRQLNRDRARQERDLRRKFSGNYLDI
jgi:membrane-associated protease RseP (regulator of RpoE activity)